MNSAAPRVRWRGWLGLLASALVGVALALAPAAPASAHASLVRTDPAEGQVLAESPRVARLTFDETVSAQAGGVQMYDARGDAVESKASARDNVLTVDVPDKLCRRHLRDQLAGRVRRRAPGRRVPDLLGRAAQRRRTAPSKPDESSATGVRGALSVVQAVGYLGLFLAAGLVVFTAWLLPALPRLDVLRRRLRRIVRVSAAVAALAGLVQLPLERRLPAGTGLLRPAGRVGVVRRGWARAPRPGPAGGRPRARCRPPRHHSVARARACGRHRRSGDGHRVAVRGRPLEGLPATAPGGRDRRPARRCRSGLARWPGRSGDQPARARRPVPRRCGDARPVLGSRGRLPDAAGRPAGRCWRGGSWGPGTTCSVRRTAAC